MPWKLASPLILLAAAAAGCAVVDFNDSGPSPAAIIDAYAIAHGMAVGYEQEPSSDPVIRKQLARLDAEAFAALSDRGPSQSVPAIAALSDFAAAQLNDSRPTAP